LLAYAVLGIVGGFASLLFARALSYLRPALRKQPEWVRMLQPAAAGLLVGGIGYFGFTQVMGAGYEAIDQAMHSQFAWKMLLVLALLKIIATTLSFSSGTPGGMFAPTLFIGAMLGAAVGSFEKIYFPHLTGSLGSYALVGMGVLFAAFLRAPLTSVFMVLEVSGNYSIVLPVILANTIAYLISRGLQPVPILEEFTHQDGLYLPSMEELREESNLSLEDAMQPVTVPVLQGSETISHAAKTLANYTESRSAAVVLVQCRDGLWYSATKEELHALLLQKKAEDSEEILNGGTEKRAITLEERLGNERTPVLFPDLPLSSALPHFQRWPLLPITNRAIRGSLEGVVSLQDVLDRYQQKEESHGH
jgi:chloride channel protein, CIC family